MELTKNVQDCIAQAHAIRIKNGNYESLCVEHLFISVLEFARYLEIPFNKPKYIEEGKEVRRFMEKKIKSIESAYKFVCKTVEKNDVTFESASSVMGRATEMAENRNGRLTVQLLAEAILESPTETVLQACKSVIPEYCKVDEKYNSTNENKVAAQEKKEDKLTDSQIGAILKYMAAMEDLKNDNLRQSLKKPKQKNKHIKQRTKIGLFTYRGGIVSAFIQYFLFGILVPTGLLYVLNHFTGVVSEIPNSTVGLLLYIFYCLWGFYILRGVCMLVGLWSKPFAEMLDIIVDVAFVFALGTSVVKAYDLPEYPTWIRIVVSILVFIILAAGEGLFKLMNDEGNITETKIMFRNFKGSPSMIFFRYLTGNLKLAALIASIFWIGKITPPVWLEKTLWIVGFIWVWTLMISMWHCLVLRNNASKRRHIGERIVFFIFSLQTYLSIPALVVFLHWLFDWFPMKTWVIVLISIWGLGALIQSYSITRSNT